MRFLLIFVAVVLALPVHQRDVATTTANIGWAQLLGLATTSTVATTSAPTAVATTTSLAATTPTATSTATATSTKSGWLAQLLELFGGSTLTTSATTATATATTATATATSSTTSGSSGWLSKLLGLLSGWLSGSLTLTGSSVTTTATTGTVGTATSGSLSSTSESPSFSGLVEVVGAGSGGSTGTANTVAQSSLTASVAQAVKWAEEGAGITYSPYTKSGLCKSASQVASDLAQLLSFLLIRLYSVDCLGITNVLAAMLSSQKLFLGVWGLDDVESALTSMALQVALGSRGWKAVHTVSIGNEVVNSGSGTAAQVLAAVQTARDWFASNAPSYSGYIVAVDTLAAVMADPSSMCNISDYLAVNCHPYFSGIEALTSGTWLKQQVAALEAQCGNGKSVLVTESGWPTEGNTVGDAVPSQENQVAALKGLGSVMGSQVIMFTTYNDYWKDPGPYNVEQKWGIFGDPLA